MYAATADIAARLGRDLTDAETTSYASILEVISNEVNVELGLDGELVEAPAVFKGTVVTAAIRQQSNPSGVASQSETLGSYQHSETFPRSGDGTTTLTPAEVRLLRHAFHKTLTGSPVIGSVIDDITPPDPETIWD